MVQSPPKVGETSAAAAAGDGNGDILDAVAAAIEVSEGAQAEVYWEEPVVERELGV